MKLNYLNEEGGGGEDIITYIFYIWACEFNFWEISDCKFNY